MIRQVLLPTGADGAVIPLLVGRALRAFADGYVAVLLPAYLLALGFDTWQVGLLATTTLLGSAMTTLAVGAPPANLRRCDFFPTRVSLEGLVDGRAGR